MSRIVVVGSINMDLVSKVKQFPQPGETIQGLGMTFNPGGKGANQAVAASRAGGEVLMVGAVGSDPYAEMLLANLRKHGVLTSGIAVKTGTSGLAFITVNDSGENTIILSAGSNGKLDHADVGEQWLDGAGVVLLQNEIPWETNLYLLELCARLGVKSIFNPAPAKPINREVMPLIDTLVLNESEAEVLTGIPVADNESAQSAAELLLAGGVGHVLVTLGSKGSFYADKSGTRLHTPAYQVKPVDTTAAGDTFIGAYAAAIGSGRQLADALKFATAAAALTVTREGAQDSIPNRMEIDEWLALNAND